MRVTVLMMLILGIRTAAVAENARVTVSLDGLWEIDESSSEGEVPATFEHRVPVPGLVRVAEPSFPAVDEFRSRENIQRVMGDHAWKAYEERMKEPIERATGKEEVFVVGVSQQPRNYFWYRTTFSPPPQKDVAILEIGKVQFGVAVWLNGKAVGQHLNCFGSVRFNVTQAINWQGGNELVMRVGAHPGVLPVTVPAGTDTGKFFWTPGVFDSVRLILNGKSLEEVAVRTTRPVSYNLGELREPVPAERSA